MSLPRKNDTATDVRCAFESADNFGDHDLGEHPEESLCFGCGFYVCAECDETEPHGTHDVQAHKQLGRP